MGMEVKGRRGGKDDIGEKGLLGTEVYDRTT